MSPRSIITTGTSRCRSKSRAKKVTFNPVTTSYGSVQYLSDIAPSPPPDPHTAEPSPYVDAWELRDYLIRLKYHGNKKAPSTSPSVDSDVSDDDSYADSESISTSSYSDDTQPLQHRTPPPASPALTHQQRLEHDWHTCGSPRPGIRMRELGKTGKKEREEVVRRCHYAWQMERRRLHEMQQEWERLGREKDALETRVREGLGRADWELAIIARRRMRELGVEVRLGTEARLWDDAEVVAAPDDGAEEVDRDDMMVDVGVDGAELAQVDLVEDVGSLEDLHRQYTAVQQQRKVLDVKNSNHLARVAHEENSTKEALPCTGKTRKRKARDSNPSAE